ncbi:hypothetical protein ACC771_21335, partial [Rhizobium ruizarguesonis]
MGAIGRLTDGDGELIESGRSFFQAGSLAFGAAILLMAGSAMASSIEVVGKTAPRAEGSIVT